MAIANLEAPTIMTFADTVEVCSKALSEACAAWSLLSRAKLADAQLQFMLAIEPCQTAISAWLQQSGLIAVL